MAIRDAARAVWSAVTDGGGPRRLTAEAQDEVSFLPSDSVVISDRKRHANKLGEGTFAKVYRGEYNGKPCAVKVFKEDALRKKLTPDPGSEGEMLSKVQHTNIVQMYGMWLDPYKDRAAASIVMELCDESLYEFIRKFKGKIMPKEKKLPILQDIARGMVYLHGQNIIHGDLRSTNVLLCHFEDGTVAKLADFDMAKLLDPDTQSRLTFRFTDEEYLPPEVFDHKECKDQKKKWALLTPKADVFCFGELVLEMGCGTYPTPTGKIRGREMLTELQRRDKYLLKLKQSDKESLGSIIRKCLADAPEGRPSFTEILLDVEGHLHKYGERPDLETLQDKIAECEVLRAEALKWEDDAKTLRRTKDMLKEELDKGIEEKHDLQINLGIQRIKVEELQQQIQTLQAQLQQTAAANDEMKATLQQLQEERDHLKLGHQKELAEKMEELNSVKEELEQAEKAFGSAMETQQKELDAIGKHSRTCKSERDSLREEKIAWVKTEAGLRDSVKKLEETCTEVEHKRMALQYELQDAKSTVEAAKTQQQADYQKISSLQDNLQAEKDKLHSTEETARKKEIELDQCRVALQAEKDKLHTTEMIIRQKEKELEQCKNDLAIAKTRKWHQENAVMAELKGKLDQSEYQKAKLLEEKDAQKKRENALLDTVRELEKQHSALKTKVSEMDVQLKREREEWASERAALRQVMAKAKEAAEDNLQAEKDKLHSTEETARGKEKELDQCRVALQAEKDKLHSMEKVIRQKEKELELCKNDLAIAKTKKRHQENAVMTELKAKLDQSEYQRAKLLEEKDDQKRRENALLDTVRELEKQHSDLKRELSMHEQERDKLKKEKDDVLLLNQQMSLAVQQQTEEKEKALKDKEDHLKQLKYVETKLLRLSSNHTMKMAEVNEKIRSLQDELMEDRKEREQLTVQETVTRKNEASEEQHRETTKLQEENSQLRRQLTNIEGDKMKLMDEMAKHKSQVSLLRQRLEQKQIELQRQKKEIEDFEGARNKLKKSKEILEAEKAALEKQVRELTFKLEVRVEDLGKKEGECDRLSCSIQLLESELSERTARCVELEKQCDEEAENCRLMEASKAVVEKDLSRARRMVKDLLDERVVVNAESEQKMENLNERLMELKHQAALSEEHLGQVQGLKDEHHDLKLQLKKLTASLDNFQRLLTDEQKSRKSLDAGVKALRDEIAQLRTELKERDNEVSSLAAANNHLRRKVDAADANIAKMQSEAASLKEQVKCVSEDNITLKQALDGATAAIQRNENDYEHSQKKLKAEFAKEREQFQTKIADGDRVNKLQQYKLVDAQRMEQDLNDQLRQYRDKLDAAEDARDKFERSKKTLEEERAALDKQVRELTFKLEVRVEELDKKEKHMFSLMKDLEDAHKAVEEGIALEPLLRQKVKELEADKEDLTKNLEKNVGRLSKVEKELREAMEAQTMVEQERDQKNKAIREQERECSRLSCSIQTLESELRERTARCVELEMQQNEEAERCHLMEMDLRQQLMECELQMKERNAHLQGQLTENHRVEEANRNELEAARLQRFAADAKKKRAEEEKKQTEEKCLEAYRQLDSLKKERDSASEKVEELQRQLNELWKDNETLRKAHTLDLQKKMDLRQQLMEYELQMKNSELERRQHIKELQGERDRQQELEKALSQITARTEELEKQHDKEIEKYRLIEDKNARLQMELGESHRVSDTDRNKLVAAKVQRQLAEKERDKVEEKCLQACQQREIFRKEAEEAKGQLNTLEEERSTLQNKVSDLDKENTSLQDQLSDLLSAKDKLQASQRYAEELEAERNDYQKRLSDSNEWIMQHLCTQDREGTPEHLPEKTEFYTMMEFFKVYYERASKRSEQTAEENQRLLASNNELKEKVQKVVQASQALQEKLSEKQQLLVEQQGEITDLRAQLSSLQEMEVIPVPLASDVVEQTADEAVLQKLCYMATGIKQLFVSPDGGTFTLGHGDASLEFPAGAVVKETVVRYAIILHGPFAFPAGYNPGSVVVYINMNGATLVKPFLLYLSHWCSMEEEDDKDALHFATAPHTLLEGQEYYQFEGQEEADFTTHVNIGILKISEPQCLHCVKGKFGKIARYSAITFTQYVPSKNILLFRIQLMCDSQEWNKGLTNALQDKWEKTSSGDIVTRFEYASKKKPIVASPSQLNGPGWTAVREGNCKVEFKDFSLPKAKSKLEVEQAIKNGQSPPCILYKVFHRVPKEQRKTHAVLTVTLHGEDLDLTFSCQIMEGKPASSSLDTYVRLPSSPQEPTELLVSSPASTVPSLGVARPHSPLQEDTSNTAELAVSSPAIPGPTHGAKTPPSLPQADISKPADVIEALNYQLDAKWRVFGTFLHVETTILDEIDKDKSNVRDRMLQLVEKWVCCEDGTANLPRTWETVVQAVKKTGKGLLAQQLAEQHGVQLS